MTLLQTLPLEFRQRCEGIATSWRNQFGVRAFETFPAAILVKHFNARLFAPQDIPSLSPDQTSFLVDNDTWSAGIIRQNPLWIIFHPNHSPARRESDLMHEFAHVVLKHPMRSFDPQTMLPHRNQTHEDEATYLGGCLQIPRRGLLWAAQRHMSVHAIALHFGASEEMVRFRSNVTGVDI